MAPNANEWTLQAAGHTDPATTRRYIAFANVLRAGRYGEPHPPLPRELLKDEAGLGLPIGFLPKPAKSNDCK